MSDETSEPKFFNGLRTQVSEWQSHVDMLSATIKDLESERFSFKFRIDKTNAFMSQWLRAPKRSQKLLSSGQNPPVRNRTDSILEVIAMFGRARPVTVSNELKDRKVQGWNDANFRSRIATLIRIA